MEAEAGTVRQRHALHRVGVREGLGTNTVHALGRGIHALLILRSTLAASFNGRVHAICNASIGTDRRVARRDVIGRSN
jgi:hypothetical protein